MVQIPSQPEVFRRPDLLAFDGLPMIDRAFCSTLRVARTLGDDYATEGMDLEEVGLAHMMENLLYTIPPKCEAALGDHPTDAASFERWLNLDMIDRLWWMLRQEKTKVRVLVIYQFAILIQGLFLDQQIGEGGSHEVCRLGCSSQYGGGLEERGGRL